MTVGWLGTGRMGSVMAARLLDAGHEVTVWNRTRAKTDGLAAAGAKVADDLAGLTQTDVVFVMVSTPQDLEQVLTGSGGLLTAARAPGIIVDCSSVSAEVSARVREAASGRGVEFLAAPVSGNPRVVAAGNAVLIASGPRATYDTVQPLLDSIGRTSMWAGPEEQARVVKICHNLYLGLIVQSLSEVTTLAERSGVSRGAFLEFLNSTGLATDWVRKRTPDLLALDWTPTFTTELLGKDFDLGLATAGDAGVAVPLTAIVRQLIQAAISQGHGQEDFLSLFEVQAALSGITVAPESSPNP
ncbi:MAG TPA: NAD(P)-dependent oxidoreductase [Solirubrobacteraceae bacterium]